MKDANFLLCDEVREISFALHRHLRHGHLEKVYEAGLLNRLRKRGIEVIPQFPLAVLADDGAVLGTFAADLFVAQQLVIEIKACRALADEHITQLLGYLRASKIEHGLLINFGAPKLEIRKFVLSDNG